AARQWRDLAERNPPQVRAGLAALEQLHFGFAAFAVEDRRTIARLHPQHVECVMALGRIKRETIRVPCDAGNIKARHRYWKTSRAKISCTWPWMTPSSSPLCPPRPPPSPLPVLRRREPSSMPGGIFNLMRVPCSERPSPRHSPHGFSTVCPLPRQRGHVCATW